MTHNHNPHPEDEMFEVTCRQCGVPFETGDEDDTVMQLCPDCLDGDVSSNYDTLGSINAYSDDWIFDGGFDYD